MDYQEAKRLLHPDTTRDAIWELADKKEAIKKINEACVIACDAIDELLELHNQGFSLERLKDIDFRKEVVEHINYDAYMSLMDELEEYKNLGTLEEVREAVEKQKRKKPCISNRCYVCQHCGLVSSLKIKHNYCYACGQHIDWSEVEE